MVKKWIVMAMVPVFLFGASACSSDGKKEDIETQSVAEEKVENASVDTASETTSEVAEEPSAKTEEQEETDEQIILDYGNAEAFEAALNAGEILEGKTVQFVVKELHPDSALGYNIWAGEHLNFISEDDPGFQADDTVAVKVVKAKRVLGSWAISYEKIENAVAGENTITSAEVAGTEAEDAGTYENNPYYDVVETASYKNSTGYTIVVHKVTAKKDASISGSVLAYSADGNVIGKSEDNITLTAGQNNYFTYSFESDVSGADLQAQYSVKNGSAMAGDRNAVEMEQYNQSGDDLYITFKQTAEHLGSFAKFKLLFYKDNAIVDTESSYFSTSCENLNGKDTTDVASVWVYGIDYDSFEYIFEP